MWLMYLKGWDIFLTLWIVWREQYGRKVHVNVSLLLLLTLHHDVLIYIKNVLQLSVI